jgi:hypothetical protein
MKAILVVVGFLSIAIGGCFELDIYQDRQHTVITKTAVPAYSDWVPGPFFLKGEKPVFILPAGTTVRAKRIRYGKDLSAKLERQPKPQLSPKDHRR